MHRWLRRTLVALGLLLAVPVAAGLAVHESRPPSGHSGADAEQLTAYLEDECRLPAFQRTRALSFRFFDAHDYLWDRDREFVRVRFDDAEVMLPLRGGRAVIREGRAEVTSHARRTALRERAYAFFVNDTFWLFPFTTLRDPGVQRTVIQHDGADALRVEYGSGGLTPGDVYVWSGLREGETLRWAMFVSVLPIGGIETSWEGWVELPTGARIPTRHANALGSITMIRDVRGAHTLAELVDGPDPFEPLLAANPR